MGTTPTTGSAGLDAAIAAGLAVAGSAAAANPYVAVADVLLTEGLSFWADFQKRKMAGTTTLEDLEAAAAKTGASLDRFRQHLIDAGVQLPAGS